MRILVVQTAFLGDVVLTLPLVEALHRRFPSAQVELLTVPAHAPVLAQQPSVGAVMTYDKRGAQRGVRGFIRIIRQVRVRNYDLVLSPHRSLRSALLVACSGSPRRIGFAQPLTRWAYTVTVPRPAAVHEVERNLQLLKALGSEEALSSGRFSLHISPEARRRAEGYFASQNVKPGEVVIGIIPGSQWGTKRWPAERFTALIERLVGTPQVHVVLFGGPQDGAIAEAILTACRVPVINLIGQTPLQALPAYLARCTVVVSNDTGPMHIAAALGKPIVALFGPTTTTLGFAPYGVPWEEVSVSLNCRPCNVHGPQRCPLGHWRCMRDITVERVAAGVQRLLSPAACVQKGQV